MLGRKEFSLLFLHPNDGHTVFRFEDSTANKGSIECPNCGRGRTVNIATSYTTGSTERKHFRWMVCTECLGASIALSDGRSEWTVFPPAAGDRPIRNLPNHIDELWREAVLTHSVGAYTSSVLMCRKIVFATAVEFGLAPKADNNRAPSFLACVNYLVENDYLTRRMKNDWADSLRAWGNDATHEIEAITDRTATNALDFTQQLLAMSFQFTHDAQASSEDEEPQRQFNVPRTSGNAPY